MSVFERWCLLSALTGQVDLAGISRYLIGAGLVQSLLSAITEFPSMPLDK